MISIVIPAYNEEGIILDSLKNLHQFCCKHFHNPWQIIVVNNNSSDSTEEKIKEAQQQLDNVHYHFEGKPGKGSAVISGWQNYPDQIMVFMDADLATDLSGLSELIMNVHRGVDICYGDRRHPQSKTKRGLIRRLMSFGYYIVARSYFTTKIKDLPCGFKAINANVLTNLIPKIKIRVGF